MDVSEYVFHAQMSSVKDERTHIKDNFLLMHFQFYISLYNNVKIM